MIRLQLDSHGVPIPGSAFTVPFKGGSWSALYRPNVEGWPEHLSVFITSEPDPLTPGACPLIGQCDKPCPVEGACTQTASARGYLAGVREVCSQTAETHHTPEDYD